MTSVEGYLKDDTTQARQLEELSEWLRIPSISTLSAHAGDVNDAANWLVDNLKAAVHQLETGNASLEDSLRIYENGVRLARRGHQLLDQAEKRVELLVREGREGPTAVPLDDPAMDT